MNLRLLLPTFASLIATSSLALAGINGTYRVSGTENDYGVKYPFTGKLVVSNYKQGEFTLKFEDGIMTKMYFKFDPKLKEGLATQTVESSTAPGTGTVTFRRVNGVYKVSFSYRAKHTDVKGSGKGSKPGNAASRLVPGL